MIVLGLDTSTLTAGCAVAEEHTILWEGFCNGGLTHSQTSMELVRFGLRQTHISPADICLYAVTAGPGSFTGLRIGLAQIKGMAQPSRTPCVGVSTLEALAWNVPHWEGVIVSCLDARRNQVYTGSFCRKEGVLQRIAQDRPLPVEQLLEECQQLSLPVLLLGDGSPLVYEQAQAKCRKQSFLLGDSSVRYVRGSSVIGCALEKYHRGIWCSAADLEPLYLRLPQVYQ